eukprot:gene21009-21763_t
MADKTGTEWTDSTWNPIAGCSLVSPGCTNCYAMRQAARIVAMAEGAGKTTHYAGTVRQVKDSPVWTGEVHVAPDSIFLHPLKWRKPRRIFVNSMSDLFHEAVPDAVIDRVFAVMALTPQHTYQVLTKRPERMREYLSAARAHPVGLEVFHLTLLAHYQDPNTNIGAGIMLQGDIVHLKSWPLPNVWLGVSVEDQRRADERIPILLDTPAALRWISAEPLLGALDLTLWLRRLHWVVAGGESGRNARPMHPDNPRSLRDQCEAAGVPYLFKQWGEWGTSAYQVSTGDAVFREFKTFDQWVAKAPTWVNGGICLDRHGKQLSIGGDFMRARDQGSFPVTIMHRVGKKAAGRLLDGVLWDQYPEVRT